MSLLAALLLAGASPPAAPTRLPPVEQCADDAGFGEFRNSSTAAVAGRDMARLTALMSDDVHVSFGGRFGKVQFVNFWSQTPAGHAQLWRQMDTILQLGCATARDGRGMEYRSFPSMFVTAGPLDGFTTWVTLPGAVLRGRAAPTATAVMRLPAWTVLEEIEYSGGQWIEVRTPKGRRGFVAADAARSIIDYRLIVEQRAGQWRITAFIAGD